MNNKELQELKQKIIDKIEALQLNKFGSEDYNKGHSDAKLKAHIIVSSLFPPPPKTFEQGLEEAQALQRKMLLEDKVEWCDILCAISDNNPAETIEIKIDWSDGPKTIWKKEE